MRRIARAPEHPVAAADEPEVDDEIDALYGLGLAEFTPARNALAKRRKAAGDKAEAAAIQKLRKPSVAAWALNQLTRSDPDAVAELVDAGSALRAAHAKALGGDASELRAATRKEQDTVAALARRAAAVIDQAGGSGQAQLERLTETLRVASIDAAAGAELRAGRLTSDLQAADLDWADARLAPDVAAPAGSSSPPKSPAKDDEEAVAARQAAAQRVAQARRAAERARHAADEAVARAQRLTEEADRAEAVARAARVRADDAGAEAEQAIREAEQAEADADATS